jgi:hypothetical protein
MRRKKQDAVAAKKGSRRSQPLQGTPASLTQAEVEALNAGDASGQRALARRLGTGRQTGRATAGREQDTKASPERVTRADMLKIERTGQFPSQLLRRLEARSDEAAEPQAGAEARSAKEAPRQSPD